MYDQLHIQKNNDIRPETANIAGASLRQRKAQHRYIRGNFYYSNNPEMNRISSASKLADINEYIYIQKQLRGKVAIKISEYDS